MKGLFHEDQTLSILNINCKRSQSMLGNTSLLINGQNSGALTKFELHGNKKNLMRPKSPFE